jgi:hypothetical protein
MITLPMIAMNVQKIFESPQQTTSHVTERNNNNINSNNNNNNFQNNLQP